MGSIKSELKERIEETHKLSFVEKIDTQTELISNCLANQKVIMEALVKIIDKQSDDDFI